MNDTPNTVATIEERISERIDKSVANELALSERAGGVAFTNAGQALEFAKMLAISGIAIPKHLRGNPGACLAVVIQAIEWRLSPFAVANKSYSVNDRLAYESQLIQAVILQRAPIVGRFKVEYDGEGPNRRCRVWAILKDTKETVEYISPPIGMIPVKNSPLWKGDPDQQLFYYSGRALCRRHFPDVILGVYAREELEERDPEDARDITPSRSLSDKLDVLANGGEPVVTEEQKKQAAAADAEKAKPKQTKKASAPKADEAAGAKPAEAGASSPQQTSSDAPATNTETATVDAATPAEAKSAAGEPTPPGSSAAAPKGMTEALRTGLKRMNTDMMGKMGRKSIQVTFDAFAQANDLHEGDAAYVAGEKVLLAHFNRVAGEGSPAACDDTLGKAIAS